MNKKESKDEIAIRVENISKTFKVPHEKVDTVKGVFVNSFKRKTFEEFKALDNVSFDVKKGEFLGIIGRNGSGKSTLLKILAGIYKQDKGRVQVNGMISPFLELGIGFNPELSGRDNIYLNGTVLGLTEEEIDEKFDSIVKFSELERFIDQKLKNYSSGMSVRLAFSVAIHANRDILLMDEVLAVGDSNFQSKCLEEFVKYREQGRTIILVTHSIDTIQKYCDQAILLRQGTIKGIGSPKKIGSMYIHQNISDEEERIAQKKEVSQNKKNVASRKEVLANVLKVRLFNKKRKEKNVFETGEKLKLEVEYNLHKDEKDLIFGIVIRDEAGKNVFAVNTDFKKIKTGIIPKGNFLVCFDVVNYFATGTYSISPAVATKNSKILDWEDDMKIFRVINKNYNSGAVADFPCHVDIHIIKEHNNKIND